MIGLAAAVLAGAGLAADTAAIPGEIELDRRHSHIGFAIKTRWGNTLQGRFPDAQGRIERLPNGNQRVHLRLPASTVEIVGSPTYTRLTRGSGFFDAKRYPVVEFVSDPYPPDLLRSGGALSGTLRIRGVERKEHFALAPAQCAQPGYACDIAGHGTVRRDDYRMSRWSLALHSRVRFALQIRLQGSAQ